LTIYNTHNKPLSFIEASKLVSEHKKLHKHYPSKEYVLATSCQIEALDIYIQANSYRLGFLSEYHLLPFNTLNQYTLSGPENKHHLILLFPWDLCPSLDWRLGISNGTHDLDFLIEQASEFLSRITSIDSKNILYYDFDIPPVMLNADANLELKSKLAELVSRHAISISNQNCFSLTRYLFNACPFGSNSLSDVSSEIVSKLKKPLSKKILITDFDNVMWKGIIGEDGLDNIEYENKGVGFIHYIYQTYLTKLKESGILIAGVTRNDEELANLPFKSGLMPFKHNDFVAIMASYNAKSSQIITLSKQLNLPLDSFVFVDDNPLELEEVSNACPSVTCIPFPLKADNFTHFITTLSQYFYINNVTKEDADRTNLYKTRAKTIIPSTESGADLTRFLISLKMIVDVNECTDENSKRAIQLINKTNQFNSNGKRILPENVKNILNSNKLFTLTLNDKYGEHGEIAAILIDSDNIIQHFVVSCRVFQRRVEHYLLLWLYQEIPLQTLVINYVRTDKNIPFQDFLKNSGASIDASENMVIDLKSFYHNYKNTLDIFVNKQNI